MVTESPRTTPRAAELLDRAAGLRADAELMDGYARRLVATAQALSACSAAPAHTRPALTRQAAACRRAAGQLRAAAAVLLTAHLRTDAVPSGRTGRSSGRAGRSSGLAGRPPAAGPRSYDGIA
ncbi:hypothetical protein [Streptomyces sp. LaPpAH-108]|uniref:hypothetical protein n=1 Tax=Streptomyces sp. LaPpAH-108 TaxID=1155714 RepID=UPI0003644285|nr:hypothetical protein [Streptomyces sp. LaPpAH-108]